MATDSANISYNGGDESFAIENPNRVAASLVGGSLSGRIGNPGKTGGIRTPNRAGKVVSSQLDETSLGDSEPVSASVVLLTHYLPLYQVRVFRELAKRVRGFKVLLSTPIEPNRCFELDWGGLDVSVQKNWMFRRRWKHETGFNDEHYLHVPYDTLQLLSKLKPDVVLSHELGVRSMVASLYRRLHPRSRLVLMTYMSEHTERGRGKLRTWMRRRLLKSADAVTYNGPSCRRYLQQQHVSDQRLFPMPYAADDETFVPPNTLRDEAAVRGRLICVGQLNERKGVLPMLRQLTEYCRSRRQRKLHITFVGQGPLRDSLLNVSRPDNLSIEIIPNLAPKDLALAYQSHGAAIHPTLADEWLMVVNESLHTGLIMIGSRYAQAVETVVRDGENGYIFDPLVGEDIAEKLDQYFSLGNEQIVAMRRAAINSIIHRTPAWAADGAVRAIKSVL